MWGYKEDLDKITPENLYDYYKEVLRTNLVDIFVVGDVDKDIILKEFKEKFKINTIKRNTTKAFITYTSCEKEKIEIETMNLKQSKLAIICKILNISLFERRYVLPLYSLILGGGGVSRLFTNVREKNSLCYTVSSNSNTHNT
jgi:predicted Zn-dependent peptidase